MISRSTAAATHLLIGRTGAGLTKCGAPVSAVSLQTRIERFVTCVDCLSRNGATGKAS